MEKMKKTEEDYYQEFRNMGFDHILARELSFVVIKYQRKNDETL